MKVLTIGDPVTEHQSNREILHNQILEHIEARFTEHAFARLIGAILRAQGFVTQITGPGPDGGVDILAAKGPFGFDPPYMCVQVKSSKKSEDVTILRALRGTMQSFNATQGLLVCWGGFTKTLQREARQDFFHIRLWSATEVVEAFCENYDRLPKEIRAEVPLEKIWMLVIS
jgi:restriction system protein